MRSMRRNSRRTSIRKNAALFGADVMTDVVKPVAAGTAGFVAARLLSNTLSKVGAITSILDKSDPAAADNTKIVANVVGIGATLFAAPKVKLIGDNRNALVIGMGLALLDRLIAKMNLSFAMGETYYAAAGVGEYVNSPINGLGETYYAAAGVGEMGEYVNSPINGLGYVEGIDPGDQGQIDSLMDTMEAAAGVGAYETGSSATASRIGAPFGIEQFETTFTPVDVARPVVRTMREDLPVTAGPVDRDALPQSTPEGRGYAGGVFARNLFSGMVGG